MFVIVKGLRVYALDGPLHKVNSTLDVLESIMLRAVDGIESPYQRRAIGVVEGCETAPGLVLVEGVNNLVILDGLVKRGVVL